MKIPRDTKCHDCSTPIKKGDLNIYHWKETDIFRCEDCAKKHFGVEIYSRVVGYMRPIENWNKGMRENYKDRKVFKIDKSL